MADPSTSWLEGLVHDLLPTIPASMQARAAQCLVDWLEVASYGYIDELEEFQDQATLSRRTPPGAQQDQERALELIMK
jgi:hypothetical protein